MRLHIARQRCLIKTVLRQHSAVSVVIEMAGTGAMPDGASS